MPEVKSQVTIKAPLALVWDIAQDVTKFPEIMPDLNYVKVLETSQPTPVTTRTVTEWEGRIKQLNRNISWTEEDVWNSEEHACYFWQLKGDFTDYRGVWKFSSVAGGTLLDLSVEYAFEIPLIGALMKSVLQKIMQQNADMMSAALKVESEKRAG